MKRYPAPRGSRRPDPESTRAETAILALVLLLIVVLCGLAFDLGQSWKCDALRSEHSAHYREVCGP